MTTNYPDMTTIDPEMITNDFEIPSMRDYLKFKLSIS